MWDMDSALRYIRDLQPHAMERGWCILLGGGVLNRGWSTHDLDLLLYPRTPESVVDAVMVLFPEDGTWSSIGVANVYTFDKVELLGPVELIFQTFAAGGKHGEDR